MTPKDEDVDIRPGDPAYLDLRTMRVHPGRPSNGMQQAVTLPTILVFDPSAFRDMLRGADLGGTFGFQAFGSRAAAVRAWYLVTPADCAHA